MGPPPPDALEPGWLMHALELALSPLCRGSTIAFRIGDEEASLVDGRVAVEAEVEAPVGEAVEESEQRRRISVLRRAETHGRPVAQNDVGDSVDLGIER